MTYRVFWMSEDDCNTKLFGDDELTLALNKCEELRKQGFKHVVLSAHDENSVGKPGVDVTGPDYDWKKRRI